MGGDRGHDDQRGLGMPSWVDDVPERRTWLAADDVSVDERTGALCVDVPLGLGRDVTGTAPDFVLRYRSDGCRTPFGAGWDITVPKVRSWVGAAGPVTTWDGREVVPCAGALPEALGEFRVLRFRRRHHVFDGPDVPMERVERWDHVPSGQRHWRIVDDDNVTSVFGPADESRTADPGAPALVGTWWLAERYDDRGAIARYHYRRDARVVGVPGSGAARYLERVVWANAVPHQRSGWTHELVLDYGSDVADRDVRLGGPWREVAGALALDGPVLSRERFRCTRLVRYRSDVLDDGRIDPARCVAVVRLHHDERGRLVRAEREGCRDDGSAIVERAALPPLTFGYDDGAGATVRVRSVVGRGADDGSGGAPRWAPSGASGRMDLVIGEGGGPLVARNLGDGRFGLPVRPVSGAAAPAGARDGSHLQDAPEPIVTFADLNGDGVDDLLVATGRTARWFPSSGGDRFAGPVVLDLDMGTAALVADLGTTTVHLAHLCGSGRLAIVRVRDGLVTYWPWVEDGRFRGPIAMECATPFADGIEVLFADMTGSGSDDVVLVRPGAALWLENLAGTALVERDVVRSPGIAPGRVAVADVDGTGRAAVSWWESGSLRTWEPHGASGAMVEIGNGAGGRILVEHASAARFRQDDVERGVVWAVPPGRAPTAVRVLSRLDDVRGTACVERYRFSDARRGADGACWFAAVERTTRSSGGGGEERRTVWCGEGAAAGIVVQEERVRRGRLGAVAVVHDWVVVEDGEAVDVRCDVERSLDVDGELVGERRVLRRSPDGREELVVGHDGTGGVVRWTRRTAMERASWRRGGVVVERREWVVEGPREAALLLAGTIGPTGRSGSGVAPTSWERRRYWSNDLARLLPVGVVESRALLALVERPGGDDDPQIGHGRSQLARYRAADLLPEITIDGRRTRWLAWEPRSSEWQTLSGPRWTWMDPGVGRVLAATDGARTFLRWFDALGLERATAVVDAAVSPAGARAGEPTRTVELDPGVWERERGPLTVVERVALWSGDPAAPVAERRTVLDGWGSPFVEERWPAGVQVDPGEGPLVLSLDSLGGAREVRAGGLRVRTSYRADGTVLGVALRCDDGARGRIVDRVRVDGAGRLLEARLPGGVWLRRAHGPGGFAQEVLWWDGTALREVSAALSASRTSLTDVLDRQGFSLRIGDVPLVHVTPGRREPVVRTLVPDEGGDVAAVLAEDGRVVAVRAG